MNQPTTKLNTCRRLQRIDDGEIFSRNDDGTYSIDSWKNDGHLHHSWSFERLMETNAFRILEEQ